jgi:hypothetical protein
VLKQKKEKVRDQQERKLQPTQQQLATNWLSEVFTLFGKIIQTQKRNAWALESLVNFRAAVVICIQNRSKSMFTHLPLVSSNVKSSFSSLPTLFFCRCYNPRRTLASFTFALHWSWSCQFRLQFVRPIIFKSSSTESSHLISGLPVCRVPSGLCTINFLQVMTDRLCGLVVRVPGYRSKGRGFNSRGATRFSEK